MRQTGLFTSTRLSTSTKVKTQPRAYNTTSRIDIVSLRIVREKSVPYATKQLNSPEKVDELLNCILDFKSLDREVLVVIPVDTKLRPLGINITHVGTLTESTAHPREIFKYAILTNAYAIFIAHNHPSGDPKPSRHDINFTKTIKKAGDLLGINLIDHVIIATDGYFSFKENQLI
jgi:DNA repair protein RadC